jgi:hypothetical protein
MTSAMTLQYGEGGLISDRHLAAGVFDFFDLFDLSVGSPHSVHFTIAPMAVPEGFSLDFAGRARRLVAGRAAVFEREAPDLVLLAAGAAWEEDGRTAALAPRPTAAAIEEAERVALSI